MSDVEALARAIRDAVLVGPMGPNSRAVHAGGGMVSLTGSEASDAARALLASDWLAAHDAATRAEAHEQGYMDGYENGLLDPGSAWMKVRESDLAAARADERALVLGEVHDAIAQVALSRDTRTLDKPGMALAQSVVREFVRGER